MQAFADMANLHEWNLRRLREMGGRLTEIAYFRAMKAMANDEEESLVRWMMMFDRMSRALRLTVALEARQARERRWDADELDREASGERHAPRWRRASEAPRDREPIERETEDLWDDVPVPEAISRLKTIIAGEAEGEAATGLLNIETYALSDVRKARPRRGPDRAVPDEPWDVLPPPADRAEAREADYRGSG